MVELAFDTSGTGGVLALARDGVLLVDRGLVEGRRHNVELLATLAQEMARFGLKPADLSVAHVGAGPGSFTGLRAACAAAQGLALTLPGCRFTRVPAVDALVHAAACAHPGRPVAASLAWKRDTAWAAVYAADGACLLEPAEHAYETLFTRCPQGTLLLGEMPPDLLFPAHVARAEPDWSRVRAGSVLAVGRKMADSGCFCAGNELLPLYPRRPEAVELWERLGRG